LLGGCGNAGGTRIGTDVVATPTTRPSPWCVPVSRERAIARVMQGASTPGETAVAKLVNGPELHTLSPAVTVFNGEFDATSLYWAVKVTGPKGTVQIVAPGAGGTFAWAVYDIDARTGDSGGLAAGPKPKVPAWDALPDHSRACAEP
ncbi:MAG: hypothetical protein QOG65_2930, partial [Actinomycetota bacterium]|nr:hypothetical protein [Actinomycetota bacterium]